MRVSKMKIDRIVAQAETDGRPSGLVIPVRSALEAQDLAEAIVAAGIFWVGDASRTVSSSEYSITQALVISHNAARINNPLQLRYTDYDSFSPDTYLTINKRMIIDPRVNNFEEDSYEI